MQSQKSERSYQDFLSLNESEFLNTYFLQIAADTIPNYVVQSILEMKYLMGEKVDVPQLLLQKKQLYVKPTRYMFATCDFKLEQAMNSIKNEIQKYDFQDEEKKSASTRRKLYQSLITSSFSDDIPICQINSWVLLNDIKLQIQKGDVLLFIVKIKASSYTLNRLQQLIYNEVEFTKTKISDYLQKFNPKIHPILILNADINFPYQKLNCQAYYVGKQNLIYHFFKQIRVQDGEAITDQMISKYNINRMSKARMLQQQWAQEYRNQIKQIDVIKLTSFGLVITFGILYFIKKKLIK